MTSTIPKVPYLTKIQLGIDSDKRLPTDYPLLKLEPSYDEQPCQGGCHVRFRHLSGDQRGAYYLIIKTFDATDSNNISAGLNATPYPSGNPDAKKDFVFTKQGNIKCYSASKNVYYHYLNPLRPKVVGADNIDTSTWDQEPETWFTNQKSIVAIRGGKGTDTSALKGHFVWDSNHVINENLTYILIKQNETWFLIYNPMHRKSFKDYYESWSSNKRPQQLEQDWGTNSDSRNDKGENANGQNVYIPFKKLFHKYCNAFKVSHNVGDKTINRFLDPTCNMFYDEDNASFSSFFRENRSTYDLEHLKNSTKWNDFKKHMQTLRDTTNGTPICVCKGSLADAVDKLINANSFVSKLFKRHDCDKAELTFNMCMPQLIADGQGDIILQNTEFTTACGNQGGDVFLHTNDRKNIDADDLDPDANNGGGAGANNGGGAGAKDGMSKQPNKTMFIIIAVVIPVVVIGVAGVLVAKNMKRPTKK